MSKLTVLCVLLVILIVSITGCVDEQLPLAERLVILGEQLKDDNPFVREAALIELAEIGPDAKTDEIQKLILDPIREDAGYVRATVLWAINHIGIDFLDYLTALTGGFKFYETEVFTVDIDTGVEPLEDVLALMLVSPDTRKRLDALDIIYWNNVTPENAVELLADNLTHSDPRVRLLASINLRTQELDATSVVGAWVDLLSDSDLVVAIEATRALQTIKPLGTEAVFALMTIFSDIDSNLEFRKSALTTISRHKQDASEAVGALTAMMNNPDDPLRMRAAMVLLRVDPENRAALDNIITAIENPIEESRANLIWSLGALEEIPPDLFPLLMNYIGEEGSAMGRVLPFIIGKIGAAPGVVESLIEVIEGDSDGVLNATRALGEIGPDARDGIPALAGIATDREELEETRVVALDALGEMGTEPGVLEVYSTVGSELREYVKYSEGYPGELDYRLTMCYGKLGELSVAALIDALSHENPAVREYAITGFIEIGKDGQDALPLLSSMITDDVDQGVRAQAAGTVRYVSKDPKIIPVLIKALDDDYWFVVYNSIEFLLYFEEEAQQAVPHLVKLLDHPDERVRRVLLQSLHRISRSPAIIDLYILALEDEYVAWAAASALGDIGAAAVEALPVLERLAGTKPEEWPGNPPGSYAQEAIKKIREALGEGE